MKTLQIECCLDCPFFMETLSDGPNYCKEEGRYFNVEHNESKGIPKWCPLPDAAQPDLNAPCTCPACGAVFVSAILSEKEAPCNCNDHRHGESTCGWICPVHGQQY
jgi:hypothetical protein